MNDNQKFCAAPWRGLHINFRGDVKTCCAGDPNVLGNINSASIESILQGPELEKIKQTIRTGKLDPVYCKNCIEAERYGSSERQWHNSVSSDWTIEDDSYKPALIDIRWNTTCNLACNYCGPYCSSKWASILKEHYQSGTRPYYQAICNFLEQHQDSIREVALVGGEPLLLVENETLLDVIPQACRVTVISNINVDFARNKIVEKLFTRRRVGWSVSFDNIGDRFEFVRYGGNWQLTDSNLRKIIEHINQGHWAGIHAVYNIYNCTRLCELREYADSVGTSITWQKLHKPVYLDPAFHSSEVRSQAVQEIDTYLQRFTTNDQELQFLTAAKKRLEKSTTDLKKKFSEHLDLIEQVSHAADSKKFVELWPELGYLR